MALFCVPKHLVEKLKESALKGEISIQKLYDMKSSSERRAFFEKYTDKELGKFLNKEFEKAMVSKAKSAMSDFVKSTFTPEAKSKPVFKNIIDKINGLDKEILNFKQRKIVLEDLVSDKLGINVTPEQIKIISEKAKSIDKAQKKIGNDLGNPAKEKETTDFFIAKKQMDDYLMSLSPASKLKVLTGTIGRGTMLASVKSPILNIGSNIELGFTEALSRRLSKWNIKGTNNKLATDYVKMVNRIYQKTGYDLSRMTSLNDSGASGSRVLGETVHAQGEGKIRGYGRIVEDIVFKQLMGAPDVAFSSAHFADSINLNSYKFSKGDKAKANKIMNDAMRLEPQTPEGEVLRLQGIMDAQKATWTDNSWASKISEGIRKTFNDVSGDYRVGDYLFPFIKTPANVISTGMDYAGMGIPKSLINTVKAFRSGDLKNKEYIQGMTRDLVRSGLGITGAVVISSQLKDDDFVGAYDPARTQIESLRNSNTNSIRVGNKWISTDWLGALSIPVSAMMYARKYGKTGGEKTFQYGAGVLNQLKQLPGVSDVFDYIQGQAYKSNTSLSEMTGETKNYIIDQLSSRLLPSLVSDIAKSTDVYNRKTTKGLEALQAKIPVWRNKLPIKTNVLGEPSMAEPVWSTILFGSRLKTDTETPLINEINKVSKNNDKSINFTNWDTSSSKSLEEFRTKVGMDKFIEAKLKYGQELKNELNKTINSSSYKRLSDGDKLKLINSLDSVVQEKIFRQYNFTTKKLTPLTTLKKLTIPKLK